MRVFTVKNEGTEIFVRYVKELVKNHVQLKRIELYHFISC